MKIPKKVYDIADIIIENVDQSHKGKIEYVSMLKGTEWKIGTAYIGWEDGDRVVAIALEIAPGYYSKGSPHYAGTQWYRPERMNCADPQGEHEYAEHECTRCGIICCSTCATYDSRGDNSKDGDNPALECPVCGHNVLN